MLEAIIKRIVFNAVGRIYPAYKLYKILSSDSRDDRQLYIWTIYWISYAFCHLVEYITCSADWLLLCYEWELLFIMWLLPSVGNGGTVIYEDYLKPLFMRYEREILQFSNASLRFFRLPVRRILKSFLFTVYQLLDDPLDEDELDDTTDTIGNDTDTDTQEEEEQCGNDMKLRILSAEAVAAERLLFCQQFYSFRLTLATDTSADPNPNPHPEDPIMNVDDEDLSNSTQV